MKKLILLTAGALALFPTIAQTVKTTLNQKKIGTIEWKFLKETDEKGNIKYVLAAEDVSEFSSGGPFSIYNNNVLDSLTKDLETINSHLETKSKDDLEFTREAYIMSKTKDVIAIIERESFGTIAITKMKDVKVLLDYIKTIKFPETNSAAVIKTPPIQTSNNCPTPIEQNYNKVLNNAFLKDFEKCPVIITAEFLKTGGAKMFSYGKSVENLAMFQCVNVGGKPSAAPLSGESIGDLFCINKENSDIIFTLKQGDKIKLTGVTVINEYSGLELFHYFLASKIEKL